MRVWLIHPCNQLPGDAWRESRIHYICDELARNGHKCLWWTASFSHHTKRYRSSGWKDIDIHPQYKIRLVPTPAYYKHVGIARLRFHWLYSWRIYQRGKKEPGPDCIIANDTPLGDSFFALLLARRFKAKLILDITDEWPEQFVLIFPPRLRGLANVLFTPLYVFRKYVRRQADGISALCKDYFRTVRKEVPKANPSSWLTVYNGIDVIAFRKVLSEDPEPNGLSLGLQKVRGELWAIYAGTLGNTYDIITILKAAGLLKDKHVPVRFIIAGDGPLRPEVERLAQRKDARLTYVGRLKYEDLIQVYRHCDVGLCAYAPGSTVAMPDKAYDYLAAGLVIVNSLCGELATWLKEKQCGVQYQAGDVESLAAVLERLTIDTDSREAMAKNSYDTAMLFDRHVQYRKYVEWVETLCTNSIDNQAIGIVDH